MDPDLRRWYHDGWRLWKGGGPDLITTVSSATRMPGRYSLVWNGRDDRGRPVPQGTYVVNLETAREHGPYTLAQKTVTSGPSRSRRRSPATRRLKGRRLSTASASNQPAARSARAGRCACASTAALRWLHIYLSLFSLLVVLFFARDWDHAQPPGMDLRPEGDPAGPAGHPAGGLADAAGTDWLRVADYLREKNGVRGRVTDRRDEGERRLDLLPRARLLRRLLFRAQTGAYTLTIVGEGPFEVLNDLHRGRDAGPAWARVVDLAGVFLTVISLTGIGLLLT